MEPYSINIGSAGGWWGNHTIFYAFRVVFSARSSKYQEMGTFQIQDPGTCRQILLRIPLSSIDAPVLTHSTITE